MTRQPARGTVGARTMAAMAVVAAVAFAAAALGIGVRATFGAHVAVDETQYALTALSLAEDGDLDISDELGTQRWRAFADVEPPPQTEVLAGGRQISPHDPLLPLLLAAPMGLGGWVGAKLALAVFAGLLAALTVWVAVRRFAVPLWLAAVGVGVAAASAPLAVYGQQIYPEVPAALVTLVGVAVLTADSSDRVAPRMRHFVIAGAAVVVLPWLSIKYAAVAAALALILLLRLALTGRRMAALATAGGLGVMAFAYAFVHRQVWGGWTVYASGDHFQQSGEFGAVGFNPDYFGRALRLVGLFVDREYGIATWQPAWLLVLVPLAASAVFVVEGALVAIGSLQGPLVKRRFGSRAPSYAPAANGSATHAPAVREQPAYESAVTTPAIREHAAYGPSAATTAALLLPLAAGWLVATFAAVTMHGYWWPGRQLVVVLPLALLVVLRWLAVASRRVRVLALSLGLVGVASYVLLLIDGYAREITWVSGFQRVDDPLYQAYDAVLPDYRGEFWVPHSGWIAAFALLVIFRLKGPFNRKRRDEGALVSNLSLRGSLQPITTEKGSTL